MLRYSTAIMVRTLILSITRVGCRRAKPRGAFAQRAPYTRFMPALSCTILLAASAACVTPPRTTPCPRAQVSNIVDDFRRKHLSELQLLSASSGTSLGYGFDQQGGGAQKKQQQLGAGSGSGAGSGDGGAGVTLTPSAA